MASNVRNLNSGDKVYLAANCVGTGAIVATDALVTDKVKYPTGSTYLDRTNRIVYRRIAESTPPVIGDWAYGAALTVAT